MAKPKSDVTGNLKDTRAPDSPGSGASVTVFLPQEWIAKLDAEAERRQVKRSVVIRELLRPAVEALEGQLEVPLDG